MLNRKDFYGFNWTRDEHSCKLYQYQISNFSSFLEMLLKLFLAFTLIPLVEIYLLIKLGQHFGAITSILLVIFTGILGAYLAKMEGLRTLFRLQETLREGGMPGEELLDALLIALAGLVLITPGFITDAVGFLLLIPFTRMLVKKWLKERLRAKAIIRDDDDVIIHQ